MTMTAERIADILAAYGADSARWPEDERAAAEAFLASMPGSDALLDDARALDGLLDAAPQPAPASDALHARIVDSVLAAPAVAQATARRSAGLARWLFGWRPAGAALATSLMMGVVFGGMVAPSSAEEQSLDLVEMALFDETFTGY